MTDGDLLYEAILANPHEDTPKLMYADWLGEQHPYDNCRKCEGNGHHYNPPFNALSPDKCRQCGGQGRVSNGLHERADFIRRQTADPGLNVNPWIRYFKTWFAPLLEGHGSYSFNSAGYGCIQFGNNDLYVQVRGGFVSEVKSQWKWFTTPSNAARVFTQPVGKVKIVDSGFLLLNPKVLGMEFGSNFPAALRRSLGSDPRLERVYNTKAEADQVLNDVCVDWGRKQYNMSKGFVKTTGQTVTGTA